jgi:hypothetical protein
VSAIRSPPANIAGLSMPDYWMGFGDGRHVSLFTQT